MSNSIELKNGRLTDRVYHEVSQGRIVEKACQSCKFFMPIPKQEYLTHGNCSHPGANNRKVSWAMLCDAWRYNE